MTTPVTQVAYENAGDHRNVDHEDQAGEDVRRSHVGERGASRRLMAWNTLAVECFKT